MSVMTVTWRGSQRCEQVRLRPHKKVIVVQTYHLSPKWEVLYNTFATFLFWGEIHLTQLVYGKRDILVENGCTNESGPAQRIEEACPVPREEDAAECCAQAPLDSGPGRMVFLGRA